MEIFARATNYEHFSDRIGTGLGNMVAMWESGSSWSDRWSGETESGFFEVLRGDGGGGRGTFGFGGWDWEGWGTD